MFSVNRVPVNLRIDDRRPMRASERGPGLERIYPSAFPNGRAFFIWRDDMQKPLKPCNEPGCPTLTREGYCEQHKREKPAYDRYRESAARRGYDSKWRKARWEYLSKYPFCASCMKEGRQAGSRDSR